VSAAGKKLVLAVIDGLTPDVLERATGLGRAPTIARLREEGFYAHGTTTFPSVTPVCLTTIATGAHPDTHGVPHLVWYHREEERLVEYGSSFGAMMRAVGPRQGLRDTIVNLSQDHLAEDATTVFEAVEDAGLVPGAINFTCYRGRTPHRARIPGIAAKRASEAIVYGPRRFFFFNLYESDRTGAPLAIRSRIEGSVDAYAAAVGRWLVTRDGFDFLVYYLPDYDYASHASGPGGADDELDRADACLGHLVEAAGGFDEFLERYAIVVCSDHGQSPVERGVRLEDAYDDLRVFSGRRSGLPGDAAVAVTASNRFGMVYRLPRSRLDARGLAVRLDGHDGVDLALFLEDGKAVVRRKGEELRFAPADGSWELDGDGDVLDPARYPNGLERAWRALTCPASGEVLVSAADGCEFADLGGRTHIGGGSHGALTAVDSTVPLLAAGFSRSPFGPEPQTADLASLALRHLGIDPPASMRALDRVGA
jgi:predicted AlkP superfamily pyrophosphatase or phosphodiesterase